MKAWMVVLAVVLTTVAFEADAARRVGGGASVGRQSPNVSQPAAPGTAQPAAAPAAAQRPVQPPATGAAQPPGSRWGGMVAGLAAGLGLAWLAGALGLGGAFAQFLLFGLLALVLMAGVGLVLRARRGVKAAPLAGGLAYQGMGTRAEPLAAPRDYSPDKVGNDASARPWERSSMAFDAGRYAAATAADAGRAAPTPGMVPPWGVPAGFDSEGFVQAAKRNFISLQAAWDNSDMATLRAMMTDQMLGEIRQQLAERERAGGGPNRTDVVMLEARLLGIEDLGAAYMASVEFSGLIREDPSAGPSPFREVWNMSKPKDGSAGWLVAGVQALQ